MKLGDPQPEASYADTDCSAPAAGSTGPVRADGTVGALVARTIRSADSVRAPPRAVRSNCTRALKTGSPVGVPSPFPVPFEGRAEALTGLFGRPVSSFQQSMFSPVQSLVELRLGPPPVSRRWRLARFLKSLEHLQSLVPSLAIRLDGALDALMGFLREFGKQLRQSRFNVFSRLSDRLYRAFYPLKLVRFPFLRNQIPG
jgi:hypothetical protein